MDADLLSRLHRALSAQPGFAELPRGALAPMPEATGVSHDHLRIAGRELVLRVPRFRQSGATATAFLTTQAAAFARAAASGHVPALAAILACSDDLPGGALVVAEIAGRKPALDGATRDADLAAMARALAAMHTLLVPPDAARAPLPVQASPFAETLTVIEAQAAFIEHAGLAPASRRALLEELDWARGAAADAPAPEPVLVGSDTHPGNFLIDAAGKAWFVDLEKAAYGAAAIDLAHATLPTSTGWDPDVATALPADAVAVFEGAWATAARPALAAPVMAHRTAFRRLTWLRTITWLARWKASWSQDAGGAARDARLAAHVGRHVARCFLPASIARQRAEWLDEPA
ncbi:MAG: aminoglycoside phosphotransferase [Alphaproteobacteria bacterium]|nr:aminoglycoside phosphotransferase [Alphaproteobacteria bacterium]